MKKRLSPYSFDMEDDGSLVNLTPLLDVLFVVLILFILITPLIELDKVSLTPSKVSEDEKKRPEILNAPALMIQVTRDNDILINGRHITLKDLDTLLPKLAGKNPQTCPQLYHDEKAPFGTYQTIKNAMETAGFQEMDVVLKTQ